MEGGPRAVVEGMIRRSLLLLLVLPLAASADEITTVDGRKLIGRITAEGDEVTILTYKEGPIIVSKADVKSSKKEKNLYDELDAKRKEFEESADGRAKLGDWCKSKGLLWQAREEWKAAVGLAPDHEASRKALGDRKTADGWETFEKQQEAKGLKPFEGRWLKPVDIEQIKFARRPYYGWVLTAVTQDASDKAFLESWGERAKAASKYMWELTEGQLYVKEITVGDGGGAADFTIVNRDKMKIRDGAYAETTGGTILAPGQILAYTFFHELLHLKYGQGHCDSCKHCIMSSDPYANQICDDADHKNPGTPCWSVIRKRHQKELALRPLSRAWKVTPVPETKVVIKKK
jgi:hypothetical protein